MLEQYWAVITWSLCCGILSMFVRRRQLSTRSLTTDRLLQKLSDESRPQSVVLYDHVTLCQRHRQQHLHECCQQQQGRASSLNAYPLLLHPCEYLAADTVARSTAGRTGDIPLPPMPGPSLRSAPASRNPLTSSMTSFTLECADVNEGDTNLDDCIHATVMWCEKCNFCSLSNRQIRRSFHKYVTKRHYSFKFERVKNSS